MAISTLNCERLGNSISSADAAIGKVKASLKQGDLSPGYNKKDSVCLRWKSSSFQDRKASGHTQ